MAREIFDVLPKWAKDHVKNSSSKRKKEVKPVHLFVTGGSCHILRTICHSVTQLLINSGGDPLKPYVLLSALTRVTAININATTIHSGLGINS